MILAVKSEMSAYTVISDEARTKWAVRVLVFMLIAEFAVTWRGWTPIEPTQQSHTSLGCIRALFQLVYWLSPASDYWRDFGIASSKRGL
jgi:hypothetical protein